MTKHRQNARVKRTYPKPGTTACKEGKLCEPVEWFEQVETCKKCDKKL